MEDVRKTKKQLIEELNALRLEQIEQTRVTQEKFTKAFLQNSIPATITTVKEGRFVEVSDAFLRLVELKRDEVIGHTSRETEFITEEQRTLFYNELGKSGRIENLEIELRPKGRGLRYGLFNAVMISINNENCLLTTIQDITDRKQTEEALRESEKKFRSVFESFEDIYFETDLSGNITLISPSVYRISGWKPEELIGQPVTLFYARPEDRSALITAIFSCGYARDYELNLIMQDGSKAVASLAAHLVYDSSDNPTGLAGSFRDITERKQAEEALRESEEKYRTILESIEEGYYEVDLAGNFTFFNDSMCRIIGYSKEEMMGMNNRQYTDKDHLKKLFTIFNEVYRTGHSAKEFDWRIIRKDGTKRYLELSVSLQNNSAGKPIGFQGICRDITERKNAEDALRSMHWRQESVIEGTHVGTWEWNIQTGETAFNETWAQIVGYTLPELAPISIKTWESFAHPDDLKQSDELLERHFAGELPYYDYECRMKHKDGHWVWVHDRGRVVTRTNDGKPLLMFGTHSDITARKLAEEAKSQLEAQNRQLQKSESLGRMAGAIAHHFNNQLAVVMGNLEMAMDELPQDPPVSLKMAGRCWWSKMRSSCAG